MAVSSPPSTWTPEPGVLYEGRVRHRRFTGGARSFNYGLYLSFLDLARIEETLAACALASARRPALVRYRRRDYFGSPDLSLDQTVRQLVAERLGRQPRGEVFLLGNLRTWGVSFNPVSFYYCYDRPLADGGTLDAIVAEITNTPWNQRHCYVLDANSAEKRGGGLRWAFDKQFHVSPFLPMDMAYTWTFTPPGERLSVHMENRQADGSRAFDATLTLRRGPALSTAALLWRQIRYPIMPALTLLRIYRQAAELWLRGTRFHPHPEDAAPGSGSAKSFSAFAPSPSRPHPMPVGARKPVV